MSKKKLIQKILQGTSWDSQCDQKYKRKVGQSQNFVTITWNPSRIQDHGYRFVRHIYDKKEEK